LLLVGFGELVKLFLITNVLTSIMKMKPNTSTTNKELDKKLRNLDTFAKNAKVKMALDKEKRNWKFLHEHFGLKEYDNAWDSIELLNINKDTDLFVNKLKEKVRKEYEPKSQEIQHSINQVGPSGEGDRSTRGEDKVHEQISGGLFDTKEQDTRRNEAVSIFNPKFRDQIATLTTQESHGCDQLGTAKFLFDQIQIEHTRGQQLIAAAGAGKTFVLGSVIKNFVEHGLIGADCLSPWPIIYVTKASVVEQTKTVLSEKFGLDTINTVNVINIEMLRASLLGVLIEEVFDIEFGEEVTRYRWRKGYRPRLIIWDESQVLAREESTQSKIANSLHDDEGYWETYEIDASATPWSRVIEAKHFAVSTKKELDLAGIGLVEVTNDNWPTVAKTIADPSLPDEHCTAAIKRFTDTFESHIVRIKNIRPKHKSFNSVTPITFSDELEAQEYFKAVERHNKRKARIEADESLTGGQRNMALLAEYTIFRKAAENCRRRYLAKWAVETWEEGFAPSIAFAFKQTGSSVIRILIEEYGWERDDISIIWGGATEALNAKKKLAKKIKGSSALQELLGELDINLEDDLGIDLEEEIEKTGEQLAFEKKYDLLIQKPKDRERERLKFQRQRSKLCMFSYKSGGVGLSLHHEGEYSHARPRRGKLTPVYSEKELVQGVGRLPRLTSVSDTYQDMCYYRGTIEEHVAERVKQKLRCLKEVVRAHESWEHFITGDHGKIIPEFEAHTDAVDEVVDVESVAMFNEFKGD
jgi:hypothetical protein